MYDYQKIDMRVYHVNLLIVYPYIIIFTHMDSYVNIHVLKCYVVTYYVIVCILKHATELHVFLTKTMKREGPFCSFCMRLCYLHAAVLLCTVQSS